MKLQASQTAVPFATTDIYDNPIALDDYRGKKLLLSFYRYASCPLCNLRIHHLVERYDALNTQGLNIVAFFQSPTEKIVQYVMGKHDIPFPIIADPEHNVYEQYGLEQSRWGYVRGAVSSRMREAIRLGFMENDPDGVQTLHPADFLIAADQTIHTAFYGRDISDHIPFEQIERFLNEG